MLALTKEFTDLYSRPQEYEILEQFEPNDGDHEHFFKALENNPDLAIDNKGRIFPSSQGWGLIVEVAQRFPDRKIIERFDFAVKLTPKNRFEWALGEMANIKRNGFVQRGIDAEYAQSNAQHVNNMLRMSNDPLIQIKIILHDLAEDLTTDFSKPDMAKEGMAEAKPRLEFMAAMIIMQAHPHFFKLWEEYEHKSTWRDNQVKQLDHIEHLVETMRCIDQESTDSMKVRFRATIQDTVQLRLRDGLLKDLGTEISRTQRNCLLLPAPESR